jgi:DNA-binding transcriptional LysR family regulator
MQLTATVLRNRLLARARLRHLQLFVRVAELGTIKRAAESVGLTQPAATLALGDLESMLECSLFLRHARGMRLTGVGAGLLPLARRILSTVDEGAEQVVAMTAQATGVVRVAGITAALSGLLVRALPQFSRKHPEVLVQLREADAQQQAALVARGDVDISFCRAPAVAPQDWRFVPLIDDRFAVVAVTGHPLLRRRTVGLDQLREATWLVGPAASAARRAFDQLFGEDAAPPKTSSIITNVPSIFWAMLTSEPLLAVLPASFCRQLIDAGMVAEVRLAHELPFDPIGMLVPSSDISEATQTLAGFLERFAQRERG